MIPINDDYDPTNIYGPDNPLTIKPEHIELLRQMRVRWHNPEFGAPEIDPKRPYGDSNVIDSIRDITGMASADREWCRKLHRDMEAVLAVWLRHGELSPGDQICYPAAKRGNYTYRWLPLDEWEAEQDAGGDQS